LEQIKHVRPLIREAREEADKRRYARAESLLRQAITLDSTSAEAWLLLAEACEKQNKQTEALKAYHELVYSNEKGWGSSINSHITTRMKYILALLRSNRWPEAVAVYEMVRKGDSQTNHGRTTLDAAFDPNRREITRLQAVAHLVLGTVEPSWGPPSKAEQKKHIEEAVRLQPNMPAAQYAYAQMLVKEGNYEAAKAAYGKAATHADGELKAKAQEGYQRIASMGGKVRP
jgi:predicted Zn-dependent protease